MHAALAACPWFYTAEVLAYIVIMRYVYFSSFVGLEISVVFLRDVLSVCRNTGVDYNLTTFLLVGPQLVLTVVER